MNEQIFSRQDTTTAKAVAIILMMIHHLFRFPERLHDVAYISVFPFFPGVEYWMGDFAKICVAMYLFLSGYGLFFIQKTNSSFTEIVRRGVKFLLNYWAVFILFVPVGLIFFNDNPRYYWNIKTFLFNFLALDNSYNGEWWFVQLYLELLILFPVYRILLLRKSPTASFLVYGALLVVTFGMSSLAKYLPDGILKYAISRSQLLILWQPLFTLGLIFARHNLFRSLGQWVHRFRLDSRLMYSLMILAIIAVRITVTLRLNATYVIYGDFLLTPFFVFFVTRLLANSNYTHSLLDFFGRHSTNIWLTHSFFCYYYFQKLVFAPKISLLILCWLLILSSASSILVNFVMRIIARPFTPLLSRGGSK
ncbi:MAG: acyltransferase [Negativicutes bacterium]|nr:acyltransferase [Negativicutes bacterium]